MNACLQTKYIKWSTDMIKPNYKTGRTFSVRKEDRRPFLIKIRKAFFSDPGIPRIYLWEDVNSEADQKRFFRLSVEKNLLTILY